MNTNFKDIGLTQLAIKPGSTVPETDALTTRTSELLNLLVWVGVGVRRCGFILSRKKWPCHVFERAT